MPCGLRYEARQTVNNQATVSVIIICGDYLGSYVNDPDAEFVTRLRNAANGGGTTAASTNVLTANTWYNVTAVIQEPKPTGSSEIIVYLNGINNSATFYRVIVSFIA